MTYTRQLKYLDLVLKNNKVPHALLFYGTDFIYQKNLAKDFSDSQAVITAWMNSTKHRENILKPEYTEIGFAIQDGTLLGQPTVLVVQLFGKQDPAFNLADNQQPATRQPANSFTQESVNKNVLAQKQTASSIHKQPLIDISLLQKQIMFVVLMGFIFVLAIDLYYMEKQGAVFKLTPMVHKIKIAK